MGKKIRTISFCIIFISLLSVLIFKPHFLSRFCPETQKSEIIQLQDQEADNSFGENPELSISPNKAYSYVLFPIPHKDKCQLTIFHNNLAYDTALLLGFSEVNCSSSMGFTESDVRGWIGNDVLSIYHLDNKNSEIVSVDLTNDKVYKYKPKNQNYTLYAHSVDLSSFIFADNQTNTYYYSNKDESDLQKIDTSQIFTDEYSLRKIVFDPFNDTFLIITTRQTAVNDRLYPGHINFQISTVNNRHLKPKIIYTSPNIDIYHPMQTGPEIYPSGKNKITFTGFTKITPENPSGNKEISILIN